MTGLRSYQINSYLCSYVFIKVPISFQYQMHALSNHRHAKVRFI